MERVEGEGVEIRRGRKKRHRVREKKADEENKTTYRNKNGRIRMRGRKIRKIQSK